MFEVDTNLWLQQAGAPWLLWLMELLSALGQTQVYMPVFLFLAFGVALRPGLALLLGMVLAGAATSATKLGFALPRPNEVDVRVLNKGESGRALVEQGGATNFLGLPSDEAIAAVRAAGRMDYGFISGHASAAAAFAIGIVLLFGFRQRWAWMLAMAWALMMGISRLYLGRHFLGDVLGGWVVGALAAWLAWMFVRAIDHRHSSQSHVAWGLACAAVAIWFVLSFSLSFLQPSVAGGIAGVLACIWVVWNVPHDDRGSIGMRGLRVLCAVLVGYGVDALMRRVWKVGGLNDGHALGFLAEALAYPAALLGAWWLARRLGLYPHSRPA